MGMNDEAGNESDGSGSPPGEKISLKDLPKDKAELMLDDSYEISQDAIEYISANFPNLTSLEIAIEYDDHAPVLCFANLSFPKLTSISLDCIGLQGLHFEKDNYPCLKSISFENIVGDVSYIRLDLPTLKHFSAQFLTIDDDTGFASSLSRCTKLETITSYKLWGLHQSNHQLYLPKCEVLSLYRSDSLRSIEIYAPKMTDLELRACYDLEHVRVANEPFGRPVTCFSCGKEEGEDCPLLKCAKCLVAQYCSKECQQKNWDKHRRYCQKTLVVNLVNANIDSLSRKLLKSNPRVRKIERNPNADMF